MGKIAFVFAGQGAQYTGMGKLLAESSKGATEVFQAADAVRPGTSQQCWSGSSEELCETKNTQPCMFAVEMACAAALSENGIKADMAAGFSLGELAALTYSGVMDFETGFRAVCRRGELMQKAAEKQPTSMAAVLRLSNEEVERICAGLEGVYPVNYNCPGQVSVAGLSESMAKLKDAVKAAGGRAVPLKVNAGFHSPFMEEAASEFGEYLSSCALKSPEIPVYSNRTGKEYAGDLRELLAKQISSPVRWEDIVRDMIARGADTFIELGPGNTLCGLIKKIDAGVRTFGVQDPEGLSAALTEVK